MAPLPWFVLWTLRKAAVIPAIGIGAVALGSSIGSFDLTYKVVSLVLPPPRKPQSGTKYVAASAAVAAGGIVVAIRELLPGFRPNIPPPPNVAPPDFTPQGLKRAYALALHSVVNYPYKHRFTSFFIAGVAGGIAYLLAERAYNASPAKDKKKAKGDKMIANAADESDDGSGFVTDDVASDISDGSFGASSSDTEEDSLLLSSDDDSKADAKAAKKSAKLAKLQPQQQALAWVYDYGDDGDDEDHTTVYAPAQAPARSVKSTGASGKASSKDEDASPDSWDALVDSSSSSSSDITGAVSADQSHAARAEVAYDAQIGVDDGEEVGSGVSYESDPYAASGKTKMGR